MATQEVTPFVMQDCVLSIPTDDYAAAISSAQLTPTSSIVLFKGLKPTSKHSFPTDPTWTCDLTYAQDWSDPDSLSRYLLDHKGETIENCILEPTSGVGTRFTFDLIVTPGAVGGAVDTVAVATVSLGISGDPVPTTIV